MGQFWKTRTGELVDVKEMTESHIQNTINMLRRSRSEVTAPLPFLVGLTGDMASYQAGEEIDDRLETLSYINDWIEVFKSELSRRLSVNLNN